MIILQGLNVFTQIHFFKMQKKCVCVLMIFIDFIFKKKTIK